MVTPADDVEGLDASGSAQIARPSSSGATTLHGELAERWGLGGADAVALAGGEQKDVWLVADEYVLRVYPAFVPAGSVDRECGWLTALARDLPEIAAPVPSQDGELVVEVDGRCAVLAPYVRGTRLDAGVATQRKAMASVLARIHQLAAELSTHGTSVHPPLAELDWASNHWWSRDTFDHLSVGRDLWAATRPRMVDIAGWLRALEGLPSHVIHNDYGTVNVLVLDDLVSGVIDWDWATIDWRLIDVAHAIGSISRGQVARAHQFIADYEDAGGALEADELKLLPTLMRLRITWTALYDLGRAARGRLDEGSAQYRIGTLEAVDGFADTLTDRP